MLKHALVAVAALAALAIPGSANAADCRVAVACVASNPCHDITTIDICHVCLLPEWSPVVPCFFEP